MTSTRRERLRRLDAAGLYFVCDGLPGGRVPSALLDAALRGGADIIQLREKAPRSDEELVSLADPFRRAAAERGALFVLNDRPDLVTACGADGVHLGQDDVPVTAAREKAGIDAVIGLSTHSREELDVACAAEGDDRPDYLSVGPIWATPTKEGRPATGLEYVRYAAANSTLPWFAIGGIEPANVGDVVAAGATRIVVVRAIREAEDPEAAARILHGALNAAPGGRDREDATTGVR
ncbi:MAG TPA: thiamine phosphate synthase [Candidatus Acidoferrum sp.]|nr:thiamine phosphate synthase [Candidatus Acidoferrum sp.]